MILYDIACFLLLYMMLHEFIYLFYIGIALLYYVHMINMRCCIMLYDCMRFILLYMVLYYVIVVVQHYAISFIVMCFCIIVMYMKHT